MPHTTSQIAKHLGGQLKGRADLTIESLEEISCAESGQMTFIGSAAYASRWQTSRASAAVISNGLNADPGHDRALIVVQDADLAMAELLVLFAPISPPPDGGIHESAIVAASATIGESVHVGPHCVIGPEVQIGDGSVLHASVTIMHNSHIGCHCVLWPGVVIRERCRLGNRCVIHSNVTIGSDGFGYRPNSDGQGLTKIPHIGTVELGDDVEIGANSAIDRGKFSATQLGTGCKIDNLVQIAHNCRIGQAVVIAGSTGIAGSVTIGDGAILGGMVGVKDHVTIGAGAQLAGGAHVLTDVPPGKIWAGRPAQPCRQASREYASIRRLPKIMKQIKRLQQQLT